VAPPGAVLYNLYGPTETNVCTYHRLGGDDFAENAAAAPPIGRVCPYATAMLIGEDGAALPDHGERIGELCVGGASVMVGYWNDPAKTAERVLVHEGHAFYRTGDIVRRDAEGRYRFIGRNDGMVKINGNRVELGEIEAVLCGQPDVDECVCVLARDSGGTDHIVAYTTLRAGATVDQTALRRHCKDFLPGYMIPERIWITSALSYTSTGKLDRQALARRAVAEQSVGGGPCTPS
jgi:acyl-coenzyme A synthetase/AMP-(fatty) acid ligase